MKKTLRKIIVGVVIAIGINNIPVKAYESIDPPLPTIFKPMIVVRSIDPPLPKNPNDK